LLKEVRYALLDFEHLRGIGSTETIKACGHGNARECREFLPWTVQIPLGKTTVGR